MGYNAVALRQMQGEALKSNLYTAHRILKQKRDYEDAVYQQQNYLKNLEERKKNWLLAHTMQHPSAWMLVATGIISLLALAKYLLAEKQDFLLPVLLTPFAVLGFTKGLILVLKKLALALKKVLHKKVGYAIASCVLFGIVLLSWILFGLKAFGMTFVLLGLLGVYVATAYLDDKFVSAKKRADEMEEHFQAKVDDAEQELAACVSRLTQYLASSEIQFMKAAVPSDFQSIDALGDLIRLMDGRGIYTLTAATNAYYIQKGIDEQIALQNAQLQEVQEQTRLQRIQNSIAQRQADEQRQHNRTMREQQNRTNEVLDDIHREQREHNKMIEDFWRRG